MEFNDVLEHLKAHAAMDEDTSGNLLLKVDPMTGSEEMDDWDSLTRDAIQDFLLQYKEVKQDLPKFGREKLLKCTESLSLATREVDGDVLTLAGGKDAVDEALDSINKAIAKLNENQFEKKSFSVIQVKYLKKFSEQRLDSISPPVAQYNLVLDYGDVIVHGTEEARAIFWKTIDDEVREAQAKSVVLGSQKVELLETRRGAEAIEQAIGLTMASIVYDFVGDTVTILGLPRVPRDKLKAVKESLKNLLEFEEMQLDLSKLRFCSDRKWKELVYSIETDMLVRITVDNTAQSVTVTGERVVAQSVKIKLSKFLSDQTSVEERLEIDVHLWQVMDKGFSSELDDIKTFVQGKEVKVKWPQQKRADGFRDSVTIIIRGNPPLVDKVKGDLAALSKKVCHKNEKLVNVPAAMQVISNIEDKMHILESQYGAAIDVSLTSDDDLDSGRNGADLSESKLCSAICPNEVKISIYRGDFTKHNRVDVIAVFIPSNFSRHSDANLRLLFAAGGSELQGDFDRKVAQFVKQNPGDLFTSYQGKLRCSQLCFCLIPPWSAGARDAEFYLKDCLMKALSRTKGYSTILFTSICHPPLKYPVSIFAKNIVSLITTDPAVSSDLTVAVYVSEDVHGSEFEKEFKNNSCQVSAAFVPTAKAISSSISSFVTLSRGSLLDQQVSVQANSLTILPLLKYLQGMLMCEI
jgi:hypothetical protein